LKKKEDIALKKKYEKPEMIIEVMSMDMLHTSCGKKASLTQNLTKGACQCCSKTTGYAINFS
jgi:hypothetical protein